MAHVNTGRNIRTENDVQNVITAIILRQRGNYTDGDIMKLYKKHSKGAQIKIKDRDLRTKIKESLDAFQRAQKIRCIDGVYETKSPFQF